MNPKISDNNIVPLNIQLPAQQRQYGYDVARALAVIGMVIVNFKVAMGAEENGPDWLVWFVGLLDGRAAATFVVLAGVGMSLLCRSAMLKGDRGIMASKLAALRKRAVFLFVFGLLYTPVWPADILHFYGFYILLGTFLIKGSDRKLWLATGLIILSFIIMLLFFDYEKGWNWETLAYTDLWTVNGMIRHIFFNGFHPVFPWAAFLVAGLWLGRRNLSDQKLRNTLFVSGLLITFVAEFTSHYLTEFILSAYPFADPVDIRDILGTEPLPPMPLYMLSAGGTSLMLITFCTWLTNRVPASNFFMKSMIITGQYALTFYVAHVVIGMGILEELGKLENQNLIIALTSALAFSIAAIIFSLIWSRFFQRGPLEWVLRKVTD